MRRWALAIFLMLVSIHSMAMYSPFDGVEEDQRLRAKNASAALNSWVGSKIDEFLLEAGSPTRVFKMSKGRKICTFVRGSPAASCTTEIFTDSSGKIFSWKMRGAACW